jgi:hypothetical protein
MLLPETTFAADQTSTGGLNTDLTLMIRDYKSENQKFS